MAAASNPPVIGRDEELATIDRVVASLGEGAACVLVVGPPGIGKTSVWRAGAHSAEAAGTLVLRTRCAELEMPIAFGALADLLGDRLDDVAAHLDEPQRRALAAALGRGEREAGDSLAVARAVHAALRALSAETPVLVAVDDLHWLDAGSRRALAWALRRLNEQPVGVLATLRDDSGTADPLALRDSLPAGRFIRLDVPPLSAGALQHLLSVRAGVHLPRPTLARVRQAAGGNPLFALEFARTAAPGGRPTPLEVPASLDDLMRSRIDRLPRRLRPLLQVVAALGRAAPPLLRRAIGKNADALVEEAVAAGVLAAGDDGFVRFAHPLLASLVYFAAGTRQRAALHARLAALVDGDEERGRHTALGTLGPDAAAAALVDVAAASAAGRGALDAAAALADEAARLTPADDRDAGVCRRLDAARWLVEAGEFEAARSRLDALLDAEPPNAVRGEALLLRAECELGDRHALVSYLAAALRANDRPEHRWEALIRLAHHGGWAPGDVAAAAATAQEALTVARALGERPRIEISQAALAFYRGAQGEPTDLRRARRSEPRRMHWWQLDPSVSLGCRLMWAGEYGRAHAILAAARDAQDRAGRDAHAGFIRCWLAELAWRTGDWSAAAAAADEATERLGDINPTAFPRALVAAATGRLDEAVAIAEPALAWAAANSERVTPPRIRWVLGLLELSRGDPEAALRQLADAQSLLDAAGIREPGYLPVLPDLAEALVAVGRPGEAEPFVARLEAAGHRWAAPAAERSRALLLLARREVDAAAALAEHAAERFAALGAPFDRARALMLVGGARRRSGERLLAGEPLADAAGIFAALGAPLWLTRAERELRRARPRPQSDLDRLTAAETRVAALVAAGRKNREVAAELFTTVATVEAHLTRIYRKLGIRSRSELVRRAAAGTLSLED